MRWPQTRAVFAALDEQARFVGGCVRNALMGLPVSDIDLCTPLLPDDCLQRLKAAEITVVPTGLAHGTVTAVVDRHHTFEITTLRRDVRSDGRHADVAFTDNWAEDAARRDLTINALYADAEGLVFDPTGQGLVDLLAGRVRFVGVAEQRIREDVLRLLRFFRFFAQYGRAQPDPEGLAACAGLAPLLPTLSGERIWQELRKILSARRAADAWGLMFAHGVTGPLLPAPLGDAPALAHLSAWGETDPLALLAGLLPFDAGLVAPVAGRLRLSRAERSRLATYLQVQLAPVLADADEAARRRFYHQDLLAPLVRLSLLRSGEAANIGDCLRQAEGPIPVFPVAGRDLLAAGHPAGPELGRSLGRLQQAWLSGGCRAGQAELLALLCEGGT